MGSKKRPSALRGQTTLCHSRPGASTALKTSRRSVRELIVRIVGRCIVWLHDPPVVANRICLCNYALMLDRLERYAVVEARRIGIRKSGHSDGRWTEVSRAAVVWIDVSIGLDAVIESAVCSEIQEYPSVSILERSSVRAGVEECEGMATRKRELGRVLTINNEAPWRFERQGGKRCCVERMLWLSVCVDGGLPQQ